MGTVFRHGGLLYSRVLEWLKDVVQRVLEKATTTHCFEHAIKTRCWHSIDAGMIHGMGSANEVRRYIWLSPYQTPNTYSKSYDT